MGSVTIEKASLSLAEKLQGNGYVDGVSIDRAPDFLSNIFRGEVLVVDVGYTPPGLAGGLGIPPEWNGFLVVVRGKNTWGASWKNSWGPNWEAGRLDLVLQELSPEELRRLWQL